MKNTLVQVAMIDDHSLLRKGLATLVNSFGEFEVALEADNGKDFVEHLDKNNPPDIAILDINMPEMDGYETAVWIKENCPLTKVLALSMYDQENSIIRMLRAGAKGYILKDCDPTQLRSALIALEKKGFYYSEMITGRLINTISQSEVQLKLNEREIEFLKLICSELTYKEIAQKMHLSPRTIDGYRDALFVKLNAKTRVGLVMYAIKNNIYMI